MTRERDKLPDATLPHSGLETETAKAVKFRGLGWFPKSHVRKWTETEVTISGWLHNKRQQEANDDVPF